MISQRQLFLRHIGQTSSLPQLIEVVKASGIFIEDIYGNKYIDLISGIAVSNLGHCHPDVVKAVKDQVDKYMHTMVYGEHVQSPQVQFAKLLSDNLPENLNTTYFVNSGSEAIEGAMKLSKRHTRRHEIIACKNAYHGSTHGALSIMGNEEFKNSFRPLLPNIRFIDFNNIAHLDKITTKTACVIIEPIQGEAGIVLPNKEFLVALRQKCTKTGTLLVFDEIQTGFGRTGHLFAFQKYNVIPDILCMAKGMGGGMPIGAFISSKEIMSSFTSNPILGHITTFGGHPVSAAAAHATLNVLLKSNLINQVEEKESIFKKHLNHPNIKNIRGTGLFMAVELNDFDQVQKVIAHALENGVTTDWFLFCDNSIRIAPPLIITKEEIITTCEILNNAIEISGLLEKVVE